ncbi:DUF488 domain-containing protein [Actinacidiphila acidipaludis]|uniref:DUF488 domain-containing protein n=1 Tax=Actinacidiphila acidipaludis TaxID=2873382 RepID=UPI0027DECE5A|nr:DUF488 domain-containing protein [Streptomyces acidipaludis]
MTAPGGLVTFGHGTSDLPDLVARLTGAGVEAVVDVRTAPGSRRNPGMSRENLARALPESGIAYRWEQRLGGWRPVAADSPDTVWRNDSFRGYAAHTRTPEFLAAMDDLLREAAERTTAVMCAESVWWRCHRRLIADFAVLARDVPAWHLMPDSRLHAHRPTPGARLTPEGLLVYDGAASGEA